MPVVRGDALHFHETPGGNAGAAVATPGLGAAEVSVIRQRQAAGGHNPDHSHDREEVLVVLDGEITLRLAGQSFALAPGDSAIIPPCTLHQIRNHGNRPAEWLLIAPAGVAFLHADGQPANPPWAK